MDKNAIKKYAIWARRELISRISQKALQYGISAEDSGNPQAESINGHLLSTIEKQQRKSLMARIEKNGYEQVMEEISYTWFNRFAALRFMEVNGYLPTHVRVFTDEANSFRPQIIDEAIHLELEGLDMEKVYALKEASRTEELYKYLLIVQCNALSAILPGMFQKIADYTELLFPDNLLREGSVVQQMIALIPEEDWQDQVQIIGWLYQYYNSEKKDDVFAALKKNVKISKKNIPAATQLFTPDWIVHYMVENSLGRLWVEGHPNDGLQSQWKYYLEEAEQEPEVENQLGAIRSEYAQLKPEDIRCVDPCCGSGHILVVLFDVLVEIYESYGYTARKAASMIVKQNLWGLDIDERAAQLSYFAVMMKARQYDRRFLSRQLQPHVYAIEESNDIDDFALEYFVGGDARLKEAMETILSEMHDAKEYGSIIHVSMVDFPALYQRLAEIEEDSSLYKDSVLESIKPLLTVAEALAQKYNVVVTNPPYMGGSNMSGKLSAYVKKNYPDSKSDLFAVFIEACQEMAKKNGYQAMITQHAWMFLSSFEKLRGKLLTNDIVNMAHLGARAFEEIGGEVVQTTSFVVQKNHIAGHKGTYCRLIEPTTQQGKEDMYLAGENRYISDQSNFVKIPGSPVAYWVSDKFINNYVLYPSIDSISAVKKGMFTGNNELFFRYWFEIENNMIIFSAKSTEDVKTNHYVPMNCGGTFRRWYGNREMVISFDQHHYQMITKNKGHRNPQFYFKQAAPWTKITSGSFSIRLSDTGFITSDASMAVYQQGDVQLEQIVAVMNSKVAQYYLNTVNESLNYTTGNIASVPFAYSDKAAEYIKKNIFVSRIDWDSYETSWDFKRHPMIASGKLADAYAAWKTDCEKRFLQLKANEEELNRIFIEIYGLQEELTPDVADKDVTVHRIFDTKEDVPESMKGSNYVRTRRDEIVSLISYALGCMFGRYSLDVEGLAYAGGNWDSSKYKSFPADADNIIPICDDEYFDDDIVGRFVEFIKVVYGADTLEENLRFIADALGGKGQPREIIRSYFINDFYKDHCKTYQKRPIYWLFDSGRKNGFKCLIYMHRYQPDTIARIRTDYVHEQQSRYRTAIADLENRLATATTSERVKLNKQLKTLNDQAAEIHAYEEKIHHLADQMISMNLDDGVKVNYAKFQEVLAKIK